MYGRWALAAAAAEHSVIYVQDDDCVVPPAVHEQLLAAWCPGFVVANQDSRWEEYPDYALLGWGALLQRAQAEVAHRAWDAAGWSRAEPLFRNVACDMLITLVHPHVKVAGGHENLPTAWAPHHVSCTPQWRDQKPLAERRARYAAWLARNSAAVS